MTDGFHFAEPLWLWALLLPVVLWMLPRMRHTEGDESRLSAYADPHLLPHLMLGKRDRRPSQRRRFLWWGLLWCWPFWRWPGHAGTFPRWRWPGQVRTS